jgi:hypothetical protein
VSRERTCWALLLLAMLSALGGCGGPPLPPGGRAAVEYWHRVLSEHPDLPAKVQQIVDYRGWTPRRDYQLPSSEVRVYGEQGEVTIRGSKIELIVTDLNSAALYDLLAIWKAIPEQAAELGLTSLPRVDGLPRRKIIVLGSQGRVDIRAAGEFDTQTIRVLADDAAAQTTIGIHTFGPSGEQALEELSRTYQAVRGPPAADVRSGYVSLPPPEEAVSVLIIGKLQELNIEGAWGGSQQEISVAGYFNGHPSTEDLAGVAAGSPFAERIAMNNAAARQRETDSNGLPAAGPTAEAAATTDYASPSSSYSGRSFIPPQQLQPPIQMPGTFQPPVYTPPPSFNPPTFVPPMVRPPTPYTPPVRFH